MWLQLFSPLSENCGRNPRNTTNLMLSKAMHLVSEGVTRARFSGGVYPKSIQRVGMTLRHSFARVRIKIRSVGGMTAPIGKANGGF
jgi:hypothetical protein